MRNKLKWYKGLNHIELESCMKYTKYNQVIQVFKTMLISIVECRCVECYNNMPNHVDCCSLWMLKHAQFSEPDNKKPHILHPQVRAISQRNQTSSIAGAWSIHVYMLKASSMRYIYMYCSCCRLCSPIGSSRTWNICLGKVHGHGLVAFAHHLWPNVGKKHSENSPCFPWIVPIKALPKSMRNGDIARIVLIW